MKDTVFYHNKDSLLVACKYWTHKEKASGQQKVVHMLSICHQLSMGLENNQDNVKKPICIKSYNTHMGGVDRVDQQLQSMQILRKTYKWYQQLALRLLSEAVLNVHKVFVIHHQEKSMTFLKFMHETILHLLATSPKLNKTLVLDDNIHQLNGKHFPVTRQPAGDTKDKRPSKICRVCYAQNIKTKKGQPVKTVHICKTCPPEPGLHNDDCFEIYDTVLHFSQ